MTSVATLSLSRYSVILLPEVLLIISSSNEILCLITCFLLLPHLVVSLLSALKYVINWLSTSSSAVPLSKRSENNIITLSKFALSNVISFPL